MAAVQMSIASYVPHFLRYDLNHLRNFVVEHAANGVINTLSAVFVSEENALKAGIDRRNSDVTITIGLGSLDPSNGIMISRVPHSVRPKKILSKCTEMFQDGLTPAEKFGELSKAGKNFVALVLSKVVEKINHPGNILALTCEFAEFGMSGGPRNSLDQSVILQTQTLLSLPKYVQLLGTFY